MDVERDYITEVAYPPQFHREHAPVWLDAVLAALGTKVPEDTSRVYCEIGCGSTFGLLLLAATNPSMTFHGIDINPEHIADAQSAASDAKLENVTFHCMDLRDVRNFPSCDYIIARGIYSWVAPPVRSAILDFISRYLSTTGVALIHYMALPGAADMVPIQRLYRSLFEKSGHAHLAAIDAGRQILSGLREGRAGFFETHPVARLKTLQEQHDAAGHTIHDYLNDHYEPFLAADVIESLEQRGLAFAGSATPFENIDDFAVPSSMRSLVNSQSTISMREAVKDFASNQFSRLDLYTRTTRRLSPEEHTAALRRLKVRAVSVLPDSAGVKFDTPIGPVEGSAQIFGPVLERLRANGVVTFRELETIPPYRGQPGLINQVLHSLVGSGAVHPVPDVAVAEDAAKRLNALLLEKYRCGGLIPALASPQIGSGIRTGTEDLDLLAQGIKPSEPLASLLP
ncbi:class I SAM-dependent methyltransferase [Aquamicrobium zhengzhouense]|uniref:Class I SAM-dependent methyltransferase n=1 Tax=Aquamicrobium zhengzhouense TaxID=2781738 RepID=A0ABS0SHJ3_9HYPH|nr:class I SAM-dependent methyltransferase [Aquamicrobium zhengzhouense]MBI1622768.1 class I SAM-dependent methyltransferase [Aquamicrobium zhengzhouense]